MLSKEALFLIELACEDMQLSFCSLLLFLLGLVVFYALQYFFEILFRLQV